MNDDDAMLDFLCHTWRWSVINERPLLALLIEMAILELTDMMAAANQA